MGIASAGEETRASEQTLPHTASEQTLPHTVRIVGVSLSLALGERTARIGAWGVGRGGVNITVVVADVLTGA